MLPVGWKQSLQQSDKRLYGNKNFVTADVAKPAPQHPDFKHKDSKVGLWLTNWLKAPWVDSQLATLDAGIKRTTWSGSTSVQRHGAFAAHEAKLQLGMCRKLCEDGRNSDAVDGLDLLVQRGCHVPSKLFYRVLNRCIKDTDLVLGRRIHALTVKSGYEGDVFLATHLIVLYSSHGMLEEAMQVFSEVRKPNAYNWAAIISAHGRHGRSAGATEAVRLYKQMCESTTVKPDDRIYSAVLKACAAAGDLVTGKEVHDRILASPGKEHRFVECGLVNMYAKCGSLEDARRLFDKLSDRDVVTWTAMIAAYAQQGMGQEALSLYRSMQHDGLTPPTSVTYVCLLQACAGIGVAALHEGEQLHAEIQERGLQEDVVLGGSLVNMYAKCGSLGDARSVFDKLPERNMVARNAMLAGYAQHDMGKEALTLYRSMQHEGLTAPSSVTYVCLLQACASLGVEALGEGKHLHAQIKERGLQEDVVLGGSLVNMYAKCGSLDDASRLFDELSDRDVVTWTTMIAGYAQQGMGHEALSLHRTMQKDGRTPPNSVTYVCLLQACASVGLEALDNGKQLHAQIRQQGLQEDAVIGCSLVNMYAKCGSLMDARSIFDKLPERLIEACNAMLAAYAQEGMGQEALDLYRSTQQEGLTPPNFVTYVCLLQACASVGVGALDKGKELHVQITEQGLQEDVVLGGSLVNMYAKCGSLVDARIVFDKLSDKDVPTWNAMIGGYAQQGMGQEALNLYRSMQQACLSPDSVTYVCLLQACSFVAALPLGKQLHAVIQDRGLQGDPVVGAAVVNMYAKCGSMFDSQQVFDLLRERTTEAWNALIGGYSRQGDSPVVFDLLDSMRLEGTLPDGITFLSVLAVCSHAGLVDKGREYFEAMMTDYGIIASVEHFICMVDLLGRAGHLDEALQMAKTMPFPPNSVVWRTLLSACQKWKDVEIGRQAFKGAVGVDIRDATPYVLMSNIYSSAQMWDAAKEIQARRSELGAWKKPGGSWWTDIDGVVHTFLVGGKKHPESEGI